MNYNEKPGTPEELVHFGVKGMRWGVRKGSSSGKKASTKPTPEQLLKRQKAKSAGKAVLKGGAKVGVAALLAAVGLPAIVAGATVAAVSTASPDVVLAGKAYANGLLPEVGLRRFSALNQFRIGAIAAEESKPQNWK